MMAFLFRKNIVPRASIGFADGEFTVFAERRISYSIDL